MNYKVIGNYDTDIIKQICETRGVDFNNIQGFLNPQSYVRTNPMNYKNLEEVARTIICAVRNKLNIGIVIDSDADGYCSSAMITMYLKDVLGYTNIRFFIHDEKQHGLTPYIMQQIKSSQNEYLPQLLIIPDASSNDYEQHKELYELGIDIVIIDHHEADKYSDYAKVVNNQLDDYGNKTLSGGGMTLKVLEAIDIILGKDNAKDYYDLASVALVGDCMLMNVPETRYYVQQGLINVNNPVIEELMKAEEKRSYESISFDVAPTINAFIRVGTLEERQDLFLALVGARTEREISIRGQGKFVLPLPEYIGKMASRIKSRQTKLVKEALEHEDTIYYHDLPYTVCILQDEALKSLTGLIGNRLVELYNKPAVVLKRTDRGTYAGSGRTTDTFADFKNYLIDGGYFGFCQGHAGAFGCEIDKDKFNLMIKELAGATLSDSQCYYVDRAYIDRVSAYDILAVDELNRYWSRGFDKPIFYIKLTGLIGNEVSIIGQKRDTIRIVKDNITYIKFKCTEEEIQSIKNCEVSEVEIIGTFSVNDWNDHLYPQVFIDKLEYKGKEVQPTSFFNGFDFSKTNRIKW